MQNDGEEFMDILEIVRAWLVAQGILPETDACGVTPGETGLFPLGQEQLWLREDVLGNRVQRVRYSFLLRRSEIAGEAAAEKLLQLQQQATKNPPATLAQFRAEKGRLVKNTGTGLGMYELRLIAEREETL